MEGGPLSSKALGSQSGPGGVLVIALADTVRRIETLTSNIVSFWSAADGWAPIAAAQLLSKSRLDWQVSLAHCLEMWTVPAPDDRRDGHQILAYATLGALVEGSMKLFLSVWYEQYQNDVVTIKKEGNLVDPDGLNLEPLRIFFRDRIWLDDLAHWDDWVMRIQNRRNAIHAYKDREIGDHDELAQDIQMYLEFLRLINSRLPYPDEMYVPREG